jgi:hypothetical protein
VKTNRWNQLAAVLALGFFVFALGACASLQPAPTATLTITPDTVVVSPALLKEPVVFTGSGFAPNEIVIVELLVPDGMTIKGVGEGENAGIGNGNADNEGNISIKMEAMTTLNTLFQVGWTPLVKPDFKEARPLPPGNYDIVASGMMSERVGRAKLTIVAPPKKD